MARLSGRDRRILLPSVSAALSPPCSVRPWPAPCSRQKRSTVNRVRGRSSSPVSSRRSPRSASSGSCRVWCIPMATCISSAAGSRCPIWPSVWRGTAASPRLSHPSVVIVIGVRLFIITNTVGTNALAKIPVPVWLRPAVGGLICAAIGLVCYSPPPAGWSGTNCARWRCSGPYGAHRYLRCPSDPTWILVAILAVLALGKMATSVATVGSGAAGGLFVRASSSAPSRRLRRRDPVSRRRRDHRPPLAACVVMGMVGFGASFKTPVAALLMVSELTGNYELLLLAMFVTALRFLFSGRRLIAGQVLRRSRARPAGTSSTTSSPASPSVRSSIRSSPGAHAQASSIDDCNNSSPIRIRPFIPLSMRPASSPASST